MLAPLDWNKIQLLVEYGPGTGRFTFKILEKLRADAKLIAIETNKAFAKNLVEKNKDSRLIIVNGTAEDINLHLSAYGLGKADYILTGLPFSTLPAWQADKIMRESLKALAPAGELAAYQMRTAISPLLKQYFKRVYDSYEWWNIPPCHIYRAQR